MRDALVLIVLVLQDELPKTIFSYGDIHVHALYMYTCIIHVNMYYTCIHVYYMFTCIIHVDVYMYNKWLYTYMYTSTVYTGLRITT